MMTGTACGLVRDRIMPPTRLAARNEIDPQIRMLV